MTTMTTPTTGLDGLRAEVQGRLNRIGAHRASVYPAIWPCIEDDHAFLTRVLTALSAAPQGAEGVERGWLMERATSEVCAPLYWCANFNGSNWTPHHYEAVRFARYRDAEIVRDTLESGRVHRICEHEWFEVGEAEKAHRRATPAAAPAQDAATEGEDAALTAAADALFDEFCPCIRKTPADAEDYKTGAKLVIDTYKAALATAAQKFLGDPRKCVGVPATRTPSPDARELVERIDTAKEARLLMGVVLTADNARAVEAQIDDLIRRLAALPAVPEVRG